MSSGSACTSASLEPSYVLRALGVEEDMAHTSIRSGQDTEREGGRGGREGGMAREGGRGREREREEGEGGREARGEGERGGGGGRQSDRQQIACTAG